VRMSRLFGSTWRKTTEDEPAGRRLLLRAGLVRTLEDGSLAYLPLGQRVLMRLEALARKEMEAMGGQELLAPQPAETARPVLELARREVRSYRQLPLLLFQLQRNPSPSLDAWGLYPEQEELREGRLAVEGAFRELLCRCELESLAVEAAQGKEAWRLMALGVGDEDFLLCPGCGYAAEAQVAAVRKGPQEEEEMLPLEEVATPGCTTIQAVADYLGVPRRKTAKAVFYWGQGQLFFVVIRGDLEVSEAKLARALGVSGLRPATEGEIRLVGAVPGYASPVGLQGVYVVADDSIPLARNLVAGANREGYHLRHVNYGRDFTAQLVTDIAMAQEGDRCARCGRELEKRRGLGVGLISVPEDESGVTFLDQDGLRRPVMTCRYRLMLERAMMAVAERHHDENGLLWPPALAPYAVHLVVLGGKEEVTSKAEELYSALRAEGIEVLYDDRDERPGVKFKDADLIGLPLRLTISPRSLAAGGVEVKKRRGGEPYIVGLEECVREVSRQMC